MPQLPFDRNMGVLLGSYMSNLALNLQRLIPFMMRCGDLLQRESLLQQTRERNMTTHMANLIGRTLEEVARSTGSVAHFYRSVQLGEAPGNVRLEAHQFQPEFAALVQQAGSVVRVPSQAAPVRLPVP